MARCTLHIAVIAGVLAVTFLPQQTEAACGGPERRLLPNGKFEYVPRQDCYPDLHSAPMSNAPRDTPNMPSARCRDVRERVLQPDGKFGYRIVQRCN
jgi:hypothetical protein